MYLSLFFIGAILPVLIQAACSDHRNCNACANEKSWTGSCRWCEETRSCHATGSAHNKCKSCDDKGSKLCSITEPNDCGKNAGNVETGTPDDFDPLKAQTAASFATIAYTNNPSSCARTAMPYDDIQILEVIGRKCDSYFKYEECYAVIAVSKTRKNIILAFRGTQSSKKLAHEILNSFNNPMTSKIGGHVHPYLNEAKEKLYDCVKAGVHAAVQKYPSYEVFVVGHSLGGAIASLTAADLRYDGIVSADKMALYTFGMPRPGDEVYARSHDYWVTKSFRIVYQRDIISKLPPRHLKSFHHQKEIFYRGDVSVQSTHQTCHNYEDASCANGVSLPESSIDYQPAYYGITIGSHCDSVTKGLDKISSEESRMSKIFSANQCKRFIPNAVPTSDAQSHQMVPGAAALLLLLIRCLNLC